MDVLYAYLLLVLFVSTYLLFGVRKRQIGSSKFPPGNTGWPILGESITFGMSGSTKFICDRMAKYSPKVFKTSLLGEKMAVFCGAEGNKFLFSNEAKVLTTWWPEAMRKVLLFPLYVESSFKEESLKNRSFLLGILRPEALKHCIPIMDSMAQKHLETEWAPHKEIKVSPLTKKFTFALACKLFLNIEDPEHIARLEDPFKIAVSGIFALPIAFPGTAYNRAIKAGKKIRAELLAIIRQRKKELSENKGTPYRDMLTNIILYKDENGECMNEMQICHCIISVLVANGDTTSSAATFVINYLAELPHIYNEVYKEQMAIAMSKGPRELLSWEDIENMKYSWNVAREALRLVPPALGAFREATTDFTFAGFTIPKGWKVCDNHCVCSIMTLWTVDSVHKNPKYFPNPEKFDPSRFEESGPAPYTFIPFGGGPRMCPGKEHARLLILVFIHNVVKNFKLEKAIANEKIVYHQFPTPMSGVPVRLMPHKK